MARRPVNFVLDHNFLWELEDFNWPAQLPEFIRVRPLARVDRRLIRDHDDWEVLHTLGHRSDVDAYITNDANMLSAPREMVALTDINLTLVVTDGVGHDKVRATALILLHIVEVASNITGKPQIFRLRPTELRYARLDLHELINGIAGNRKLSPTILIQEERAAIKQHLAQKPRR